MRLWTYHPVEFRLDDCRITAIDPSKGPYWNDPSFCYEAALRKLCRLLGAKPFPLWCFTAPGCWVVTDGATLTLEWELEVPESHILGFVKAVPWHDFIRAPFDDADDFSGIIIAERPIKPEPYTSAVVRFPLSSECRVRCLGRVAPQLWRDELRVLKGYDRARQDRFIAMYKRRAADTSHSSIAHKLDADRARYLEEELGLVSAG
jgi:hypothetical protein